MLSWHLSEHEQGLKKRRKKTKTKKNKTKKNNKKTKTKGIIEANIFWKLLHESWERNLRQRD